MDTGSERPPTGLAAGVTVEDVRGEESRYPPQVLLRWLAAVVLSAATIVLALVGIAGGRQVLEPTPPDSPAAFTERIEAAGIACGGVSASDANESTFVCGDDLDVRATFYHRLPTGVRYSGSYTALEALDPERGLLSGGRFVVEGPYGALMRVQQELGGDLQRLSGGQ